MKYELMHRTIPTAVIEIKDNSGHISKIESIAEPYHMPVGVIDDKERINCDSLDEWWRDRSIPIYRPRVIKLLVSYDVFAPYYLLPRSYGLSLSDQYWIRPVGSDLEWEKINYFDNPFSEDSGNFLLGLKEFNETIDLNSPDYTTNGNLEKCWRIINGKRYLVKGGEYQEPLNEVIASKLMKLLGISHIPYTLTEIKGKTYSLCEDFVDQRTELIPAWRILEVKKRRNETSAWQHFVNCCDELGIPGTVEFLDRMIVVDCIIANEGRHYNNFGALRNAETLEWLGMAPIYDSGSSLGFNKEDWEVLSGRYTFSKPFRRYHEEQLDLVTDFSWIDFCHLSNICDIIHETMLPELRTGRIFERRIEMISKSVQTRINFISNVAEKNMFRKWKKRCIISAT